MGGILFVRGYTSENPVVEVWQFVVKCGPFVVFGGVNLRVLQDCRLRLEETSDSLAGQLGLGGDDLDFEEEFGADESGDDEEHEGWAGVAEDAAADFGVGGNVFGAGEVLGDLDDGGDGHASLVEDAEHVLPG